jgi:hypothetical protein
MIRFFRKSLKGRNEPGNRRFLSFSRHFAAWRCRFSDVFRDFVVAGGDGRGVSCVSFILCQIVFLPVGSLFRLSGSALDRPEHREVGLDGGQCLFVAARGGHVLRQLSSG